MLKGLISRLFKNREQTSADTPQVERAEWNFYLSYIRPGMTVFDVGAYFGELTLMFSHFVTETGSIHSFEAHPDSFQRLKTIVEASGRKNIRINPVAVSNQEAELQFFQYDAAHQSWSGLVERPLENYGVHVKPVSTITVPGTTIDSYCEKNSIKHIDLLKIDVEGAEYQVMLGAEKMFDANKIACCIFEFGQTTFDMGNRPEQIETFLKRHGYDLQNVVSDDPVFPGRESAETARFSMHVAKPRN